MGNRIARGTWTSLRVAALALALTLLGFGGVFAAGQTAPAPARAGESRSGPAAGEALLLSRIVAPCCWTQTLDVHDSELVRALRSEIRERLRAGEAPDAIEDDLAARFGERIRAMPRGEGPAKTLPIVIGVLALAGGAALLRAIRRWVRRGLSEGAMAPKVVVPPSVDVYDERLDEELRQLDGR
jgi:cytochrome c-type biogenesis protein CcmH